MTQDEAGPITTLAGGGYGFVVGSGFASEHRGIRGVGYGFVVGTGAQINRIGLIAGSGYGFVVGTGALANRTGLMVGSGYGFVIGTGLLTAGIPVVVILHRRLSPVQPRLRHLDYTAEHFWIRKVSPKSERVRTLS